MQRSIRIMVLDFIKALSTAPLLWIMVVWAWALWVLRKRVSSRVDKRAWRAAAVALIFLWMVSFVPLVSFAIRKWEGQYTAPEDAALQSINTIVVLGGGVEPSGGLRSRPQAVPATYYRVQTAVAYAKRAPNAQLVLSGAADRTSNGNGETNAQVMKELVMRSGIDEDRIMMDPQSTTTAEHAIELRRIVPLSQPTTIGIVTSALHMRRSMEIFQHILPEYTFMALPADTLSGPVALDARLLIPSVEALEHTINLLHELLGAVWYQLRY